ncbi:MAG: hypothetical protein JWP30_1094 [Homoserinimonas sp.]|jgi:uncharacterized protein (DUF488 family)|nr:hypothetical protein [Homoserinimonas sp.]
MANRIYTVGHSTHPIDAFVALVKAHGVNYLVDVRTIARSRHNPQFGEDQLMISLPLNGIGYLRLKALGGLRNTTKESANTGWKNASFRGYADYMQTRAFTAGVEELLEVSQRFTVAIMCAEAVPWRCHRSLIGDALLVRNVDVLDIMTPKSTKPHTLTDFASVDGLQITYPPPTGFLV